MLPSLTVECATGGCAHVGKRRRVHLRTAAPGVLELPRLVCAGCGFDMPTVTPWPPVTESEDETMPKITAHGGASNRYEGEHGPEIVRLPYGAMVHAVNEGSEEPSAGSNSETSSPKSDSKPKTNEPAPQKRARTTASRSKKAQTGSSSARSTGGGQEADTSAAEAGE